MKDPKNIAFIVGMLAMFGGVAVFSLPVAFIVGGTIVAGLAVAGRLME